jgi:ergothioneine biosynthesis protein EgtB
LLIANQTLVWDGEPAYNQASSPGDEPMTTATPTAVPDPTLLADDFRAVRRATERLCKPLSPEDCLLQSMPEASPAKWHLAHTTWFFETFVLAPAEPGFRPFRPEYSYLFNSYYEAVGPRHPRPQRGVLSRPPLDEVYRYRAAVDERVGRLLTALDADRLRQIEPVVTLGMHHEQQHQELILTDIQHAFSASPLRPAYREPPATIGAAGSPGLPEWIEFPAKLRWIGHAGDGFAFDNETPRHRVWVEGFRLAARLVTCGEFLHFMDDGGYERPELWLSDGWAACRANGWRAPQYWERDGAGGWRRFNLFGKRPIGPAEPVCHVSYYEGDAYARWAGARLPTEAEWEAAAAEVPIADDPDEPTLCPRPWADGRAGLAQLDRDVWQWTGSPYVPYPGFQPAAGALGEYNGKFMCNQMVLRGGSCATPRSHLRRTYRNFFPPEARWQFSGLRLASDR